VPGVSMSTERRFCNVRLQRIESEAWQASQAVALQHGARSPSIEIT